VASTKTKDNQSLQQAQAPLAAAQQDVASTKTKDNQSLQQTEAQLAVAQGNVASTKTKNGQSAQQAQAQLAAAQGNEASTNTKNGETTQQAQAQLAAAQAGVTSTNTKDQQSAQQAEAQLNAARLTLSQDESALADDRDDAAIGATGGGGSGSGGGSPTYTYLPQVGQVVRRGQELFAIDGQESILFYGNVTPWRAFMPGMSPGPDVAALNTNLNALGYGKDLGGDIFTAATEAAVKAFQSADHMPATGQIALGSVLFEPGTVEVNSVAPTLGSSPSGGQAVLQVTLTARQVQIALDASQQSDVAVGDAVSIVMPDNSTTPGVVSYVGTIATTPSSQNGGSGTPTINVNVTPLDPAATGNLDDLPVNVWITEASVPTALVVQVDALVALSGGGYALEVAPAHGAHYLEAVSLGLFDDADGLVQVTGAGVQAGQRIVVPQV
jgi:multidrug efflux pump subunit AcrA (membrane-fusion protein)